MFDTVLFDLDGTLTDSGPGILNSVEYALRKYGRTGYRREELVPFIGPPLVESFESFIPCSHEDALKCLAYYREYFTDKGLYENSVYPGVEEMLAELKRRGYRIALATAKPEVFARKILDHFDLTKYFDAIHGATLDEKRNHKADVIAWALTHTPGLVRAVMVGDRENDVSGAKVNNLDVIGVLYGYGDRAELETAGAKTIIERPEDLLTLLPEPDKPKVTRHWFSRNSRKAMKHALLLPFEWLGIAMAMALILPLPRRWMFALCDALSAVMYFFDYRGKRRALENLHIIRGKCVGKEGTHEFDPDSGPYLATPCEAKIIRRSYRNMARSVGYAFWTLARARKRCAATGGLSPEAAAFLAAHKPAVTVSAHLGCWEILSQLAFLAGHEMMSVAKDVGTHGMTALLMKARRSIGQEIVSAKGAFKPLLKGVRAGKSLGLLVDQKVGTDKGGIWIEFLGRPMPVSAAPAYFAAKLNLPIVVAWSRPLRDGSYRCEMISTYEGGGDVWRITQSIADDLGRVIRRHPSCWILSYNYFRAHINAEEQAELDRRKGSI